MKSIDIISVPVSDQQIAKKFYLTFGFTIVVEAPFGDQQWIQMGLAGGGTTITLVNWFPEMPTGSLRGFVIGTDDIEKEKAHLEAAGIAVEEIEKTPWGRFAAVKDPDGNRWSLHQQ